VQMLKIIYFLPFSIGKRWPKEIKTRNMSRTGEIV